MLSIPMTVVETPSFIREARVAMGDREKEGLVLHLASNPDAGDMIHKSVPLFLLNVFAKIEKASLTQAERNEMKAALPVLVATYRKAESR